MRKPTLAALALALTGAADLTDTIAEHPADPAAQALALDRLVGAHVMPFYHDQAAIDAARLAMMRHTVFGAAPPGRPRLPAGSPIPSCAWPRPTIRSPSAHQTATIPAVRVAAMAASVTRA